MLGKGRDAQNAVRCVCLVHPTAQGRACTLLPLLMCVHHVGQRPRCTKRGALCMSCAPYSTGVRVYALAPVNVCASCWAKAAMHKTRCVVYVLCTLQHRGARVRSCPC